MTNQSAYDTAWTRLLAYGVALIVPPLFALSLTPSPTLLNELLAVCGWGLCLALHQSTPPEGARRQPVIVLWLALGAMAAAVVGSWTLGSLPTSLAVPPLAMLIVACAVAALGARVAQNAGCEGQQAFAPFAIGMVIVGLASCAVAVAQVFWPDLPDGNYVARSGLAGRAVGNLRQPNHLASLLIWSVIALVPLVEWRLVARWLGGAVGSLLILGVILSGSRTGLYGGVLILVLWGALDRRLSRGVRTMLMASLPVASVLWFALARYLAYKHSVFGAAARLGEGDSSHFAIWRNALDMIAQQPWLGVGWGEFNFAWTLTPFPHRPTAFFDHTHDLPLQLAVELGVPGAIVVLGLLIWALAQGARRAWGAEGAAGHGARAAWVMIAMIGLHSLDEYPLWYAYFLLPAAWAWGFTLGSGPADPGPPALSGIAGGRSVDSGTTLIRLSSEGVALRWIGGLMMALAALASVDYWRISTIFSDEEGLPPLAVRISSGQSSPLFAHHADYADATTAEPPSRALGALERATHSLLDTRLMIAWANALAESGQYDRARYIAARLLEFKKDDAEEFFAPCADATVPAKPFQCQPEPPAMTWRDFR
ncbi:MAG: Wzy polymerase domain-containing protein [Burkholderiaceae bacterium]